MYMQQNQFLFIVIPYAILFAVYFMMISKKIRRIDFWVFILSGFVFRILFFFEIPSLTTDFYRFIWDGRILYTGINPYTHVPLEILKMDVAGSISESFALLNGMGSLSAGNPTCYPPLNQLIFYVAAVFFPESIKGSIIVVRLIILLSEAGSVYFIIKILQLLKRNQEMVFVYFLNPLVIVELTGNLHFEAVMIFLILVSLYFLIKNKLFYSAVFFALSVLVKLISLIFILLLLKKLGRKNWIWYLLIVLLVNVLFFIPFFSTGGFDNFLSSLRLFIQTFEFNAGIYFIVREIGYSIAGYNLIRIIGPALSLITLFVLLYFSLWRNTKEIRILLGYMTLILTIFYMLSTTVHPWYICTILALSVFTRYNFPVLWSALIVLSYSVYDPLVGKWNYYLVSIEYIILIGYFIWELLNKKNTILFRKVFK